MAGFGIVDYVILVLIILGSLSIGIFYGRKKQDTKEYTTGRGQMGILPVSLSLTVSYISAITIQVCGTALEPTYFVFINGYKDTLWTKNLIWSFSMIRTIKVLKLCNDVTMQILKPLCTSYIC